MLNNIYRFMERDLISEGADILATVIAYIVVVGGCCLAWWLIILLVAELIDFLLYLMQTFVLWIHDWTHSQ